MTIRPATCNDIPDIMVLYEAARHIMRTDGNMHQWTNGYPQREVLQQDIDAGNSYVVVDAEKQAIGTFAFILGIEPTYLSIYEGEWIDDSLPYATIHRLASSSDTHGIAQSCFSWAKEQGLSLRADTHRDNHIMQHILLAQGFRYCGIIFLANGDERLAYQWIGDEQSV